MDTLRGLYRRLDSRVRGLSAVAVGLGVLTGRGFDSDDDLDGHHNRTTAALAGLALTCIAVGAGITLV